jgi:sugar lactone lactonase YvrE
MKTRLTILVVAVALLSLLVWNGGALLWTRLNTTGSGFNTPSDVAVSMQGNIYVVDSGHSRIVEMTPAGKKLGVWNTNPKHYGDNDQPQDIWVDRYGNVYTTAGGCHPGPFLSGNCSPVHGRAEVFSPRGRPLPQGASLPVLASDPYGNIYTCSSPRFNKLPVRRLPAAACSDSTPFVNESSWIVDARGRLLEGNGGNPCPCVSFLSTTGTCPAADQPCDPHDPWRTIDVGNTFNGQVFGRLAVDRSGDVFAAETPSANVPRGGAADRVAKIAPNGTVQAVWTGFANAAGVAVGSDGSVYVTDSDQNLVVKLSASGKKLAAWSGPTG